MRRRNMTDEQRAKEQAYQEYLKLREKRPERGEHVQNDDMYGAYFTRNVEDTPYGTSEMRKKSKREQTQRKQLFCCRYTWK